jgi:ATP-binding cassette, subfamily C, bacterial
VPPGATARGWTAPVLRGVTVDVSPGQALAVIGPAGAGKSALLRALAGAWPIAAGQVRLGGEDLSRWSAPALALGYLPERPALPPGTLAEAIASRDPCPDPARIAAALDASGATSLVRALPSGLDTVLGHGQAPLSAGQVQRLALARALYGDPALVLLDAPDAGLDAEGVAALTAAIRSVTARGGIAVVAAQRPQVIAACDLAIALAGGKVVACGARDAVLRESVANHPGITGEFPSVHGGPVSQVGGADSAALRLAAQRRGAA